MDIVVVGHLSRDLLITPSLTRETLGGGSAYAMLATSLGAEKSAIVSKVGADFNEEYMQVLQSSSLNLHGLRKEGPFSTRFINEYDSDGQRIQRVDSLAPPIAIEDFPEDSLKAKVIHFCPLSSEEISASVFESVASNESLISLDAQGFLRAIKNGLVKPNVWSNSRSVLQHVDILKVDSNELTMVSRSKDERNSVRDIMDKGPSIIIVTRDKSGSTIYTESAAVDVPLIRADRVVDTTGSGDTYTIGFLLEYTKCKDIQRSGLFGASCASFNLENIGPYKMPTRQQVLFRLANL